MKLQRIALLGLVAAAGLGIASLLPFVNADKETAVAAEPAAKNKEGFRELDWSDLSPPFSAEAQSARAELNLRVDEMSDQEFNDAMKIISSEGSVLVSELDDTDVSLEGFLVPLDFDAEQVSEFVLVPYFGACIHVPPPPPNQIVYVKFREGLAMSDLETAIYTPFRVNGRIKAAHAKTELADVGYQLTASDIKQGEPL